MEKNNSISRNVNWVIYKLIEQIQSSCSPSLVGFIFLRLVTYDVTQQRNHLFCAVVRGVVRRLF